MKRYRNVILEYGPLAYWPFSETNGSVLYPVVGNNNFTLAGSYTLNSPGGIAREPGGALYLDGATGYASSLPVVSSLGQMTILLWSNPGPGGVGTKNVIDFSGSGSARTVIRVVPGQFFVRSTNGLLTTTIPITFVTNSWAMYAVTFDGMTLRTYVNGVLESVGSWMMSLDVSVSWVVGASSTGGAERYQGLVQHFAVFNRPLTGSELLHLYLAGLNGVAIPNGII
ncbi:MAG: hypothetical protein KatS3mg104_3064 [Phycisphaerae bacterium]|nr:MAG: hypothetical protein KatS3mg104_3064 [Phycisphaerae bacterium]